MSDPICNTMLLDMLRSKALVEAAHATDPLVRQQYVDLADAYASSAVELRAGGGASIPMFSAMQMPWRSVPLWVSNDR